MGTLALLYLIASGEFSLAHDPAEALTGMDSFLLLAIPFFLLAGALMNHGGVTRRLVDFASTLVGHIAGGLGHVTVVANVIMAGMSGTAAADAAATGTVLIPEMIRRATRAASPPRSAPRRRPSARSSRRGRVRDLRQPDYVSIGELFLAGVIPGLLMGVYLMAACYLVAKRRGYGAASTRASLGRSGAPSCAPPRDADAGMGARRHGRRHRDPDRSRRCRGTLQLLLRSRTGSCVAYRPDPDRGRSADRRVYFLLGVFNMLGWILAVEQIPQTIRILPGYNRQLVTALLIINVVVFLLGILIEPVPLMVLVGPMLMPVIRTTASIRFISASCSCSTSSSA